jgi:hypothetical protein
MSHLKTNNVFSHVQFVIKSLESFPDHLPNLEIIQAAAYSFNLPKENWWEIILSYKGYEWRVTSIHENIYKAHLRLAEADPQRNKPDYDDMFPIEGDSPWDIARSALEALRAYPMPY